MCNSLLLAITGPDGQTLRLQDRGLCNLQVPLMTDLLCLPSFQIPLYLAHSLFAFSCSLCLMINSTFATNLTLFFFFFFSTCSLVMLLPLTGLVGCLFFPRPRLLPFRLYSAYVTFTIIISRSPKNPRSSLSIIEIFSTCLSAV